MDDDAIDGRTLRRTRNRAAVLDATIEIFAEGNIEPSVGCVAERAGVSNRSIYRYFEDRDRLEQAAVAHALQQILQEFRSDGAAGGTLEQRIERFVDDHLRVHERYRSVIRAARHAAQTQPAIRRELEAGERAMNTTFFQNFARELDGLDAAGTTRTLLSAAMVFEFESVDFLCRSTDGDIEEVRAILVDHLRRLLGSVGSDPTTA